MKLNLTPEQHANSKSIAIAHKHHCAHLAGLYRKNDCRISYKVTRQDWVKARDLYKALTNQFEVEK